MADVFAALLEAEAPLRSDSLHVHRYVLVGDGGHANEVSDLLHLLGGTVVGRVVDHEYLKDAVSPETRPLADLPRIDCDAVVLAMGDTAARQRIFNMLAGTYHLPSVVHPSASVSPSAALGSGVVVMQNVVVAAQAVIGDAALLNVACYVAHDCRVGSAAHVGPGVQLGGRSSIGEMVLCGASATVLPDVSVGIRSVCGAGAVVTRDVPPNCVVSGVPAVPMQRGL